MVNWAISDRPKAMIDTTLSRNLRLLTGYAASVSQVCRGTGVNRTQYHRYLAGQGEPSLRSLRRICDYFGVEEHEILQDPDSFRELIRLRPPQLGASPDLFTAIQNRLTEGDETPRVAMGYYHMVFRPDPKVDLYYRNLLRLSATPRGLIIKQIERYARPAISLPRRMVYEGTAFTRYGILFGQVQEKRHRRSTWFLVLSVGVFSSPSQLHGYATGCEPEGLDGILSFPVVLLHLGERPSLRSALADCGYFTADEISLSPHLDNALRSRN
ncbi:MAG: helix-turn-helix domain-containing protein [Mesorhizobium sp.]|nr:XRE family transcriptional regulator [Mesorhizobium sp. M2A.F.Ca.ET.046.03.2.1]RVC71092.1 helix-turn-helix domain-containing protein [Mesorhizobium sp. M00.F.Ca.ET.038.03.1.1]RVC80571.1 helix-turn-helix domain-containing protein [Mesorhizobium sp. M2A.F.Ca.ET.046.02.1.1]RWE21651.1 MAG: helix-turn-helix domain-containing protein [Mesorhizobium sp.]RWF06301.1 MAG: helix-turn-helix domain-containing protein [Mesorhizobium sp.]